MRRIGVGEICKWAETEKTELLSEMEAGRRQGWALSGAGCQVEMGVWWC